MPFKDRDRRLEYQHQWYIDNKDRLKEKLKNYRKLHKASGLCRSCNKPVLLGYSTCPLCGFKANALKRKEREDPAKRTASNLKTKMWYEKCVNEGRCTCGVILLEDEKGVCFACLANKHTDIKIPRKRGIYRETH